MLSDTASEMPPWKKELILRRRSKSSTAAQLVAPQTSTSTKVHQPNSTTCSSSSSPSRQQQQQQELSSPVNGVVEPRVVNVRCDSSSIIHSVGDKMVQERIWSDRDEETSETSNDFDSSEELKYGPGIVSKLKNRYLSLTLRETTIKTRPSILTMRKATSLENILDDNNEEDEEDLNHKNKNNHFNISNGYSKHIPNRYKSAAKKPDMKRARSVEYISSNTSSNIDNLIVDVKPKRESLHEDMLDTNRKEEVDKKNEINDIKTFSNNLNAKVNRPKRIQPIMAEKEKPPLDVVKQTKKMFERPELRSKAPVHTGDVAAKVATFKEIIQTKKPIVKQKPNLPINTKKEVSIRKNKLTPNVPTLRSPETKISTPIITKPIIENLPSPIPDVSLVQNQQNNDTRKSSLTDTPDLIVHSSPKPLIEDIKEIKIQKNGFLTTPSTEYTSSITSSSSDDDESKKSQDDEIKMIPKNQNFGNPLIFDFTSKPKVPNHLPLSHDNNQKPVKLKRSTPVTSNNHQKLPPKSRQKPPPPPLTHPLTVNVPIDEPLKIEITTFPSKPQPTINNKTSPTSSENLSKNIPNDVSKDVLKMNGKVMVSEKLENLKNTVKNSELIVDGGGNVQNQSLTKKKVLDEKLVKKVDEKVDVKIVDSAKKNKDDDVPVFKVLKRIPRKQEQQNCLVFDFTTRKDVPDYVANDVRIPKIQKVKKPKTGEGGIILLPGATWESTTLDDDDEDWEKSLEGPPSPLLVTFINDNVLIDGKSSLNQKRKKPKMSLKFVESEPDIFFYPSECSIIAGDESQTTTQLVATNSKSSVGHNVPSLSGSTLANYKSKTANQIEDFQLGMKPTTISSPSSAVISSETLTNEEESVLNEDIYQPIAFSAGNNTTDILF